jgi:hypothetical protein
MPHRTSLSFVAFQKVPIRGGQDSSQVPRSGLLFLLLISSSSWSDAAASQAPSDSFSYSFTPHLFLPGLTVPDLRRRLQNRFHTHRHDCYSIACRWTQPGWSLIVDAQVGSRPFRWISFHDSNERASREHVCVLSRFVSIKSLNTSYHLTVIFPSNFLVASTYVF